MPGDRRSPVVAGDDRLVLTERVHQRDDVAGQVQDGVLADAGVRPARCAGAAVAALIRSHRVIASGGERGELMPPGVPALREAVQQQDERTLPRLGDVHVQAAGLHVTMGNLGHVRGRLGHGRRIALVTPVVR